MLRYPIPMAHNKNKDVRVVLPMKASLHVGGIVVVLLLESLTVFGGITARNL